MEPEDIYTELLGVPPGPRPPNHYEILRLPLFETDKGTIHEAVLSQTAKLKQWVLDPRRMDRVQGLLNEVNRAGFILEDPPYREKYERELADRLGISPPIRGATTPDRPPTEEPAPPVPVPTAEPGPTEAELRRPRMPLPVGPRARRHPGARGRLAAQAEDSLDEAEGAALFNRRSHRGGIGPGRLIAGSILGSVALVALGFLLGRASAPGSAEVGPKETAQANVVKLPEPSSATPPPPMSGPPASRAEISKATFPKIAIAGQAVAVDLGGGVKLDLVRIPAGSFSMGSDNGNNAEKPVHTVTFAKPFYMGKTEVTQEQWQAVVGINLSRFEGPKNPVEQVSWYDCQEFIRKLSGRTGMRFSLPSEAEWEYACRAGSAVDFCYGDNEAGLSDYAWYISNAGGQTHPVGQTRGNAWGLFDMHGNVWEWCQDVWHSDYQGAPSDGTAWIQGGDQGVRVRRGGSWLNDPRGCRSSDRIGGSPRNIWDGHGVRVVLREF